MKEVQNKTKKTQSKPHISLEKQQQHHTKNNSYSFAFTL